MSKDNVGGAAFPTYSDPLYLGMTLRDYFAAQMLASVFGASMRTPPDKDAVAKAAYAMADAMLKAREA
jgi:hypothetical protein